MDDSKETPPVNAQAAHMTPAQVAEVENALRANLAAHFDEASYVPAEIPRALDMLQAWVTHAERYAAQSKRDAQWSTWAEGVARVLAPEHQDRDRWSRYMAAALNREPVEVAAKTADEALALERERWGK